MTEPTQAKAQILHGDCIEVMKTLPANSVDSIVTDPPYGLGFMGKAWDALPPGEDWARECLRVLKPGGHLLAFGGTRTWHRLAVAVEDAGFEIRDSIAWIYGSGFPKHRAALKPAFEPIVMARKPYKGSLTANEALHGTGALNIDATRIGMSDADRTVVDNRSGADDGVRDGIYSDGVGKRDKGQKFTSAPGGRWPANVVLDEDMTGVLDEQSGFSKSPSTVTRGGNRREAYGMGRQENVAAPGDSGGASRFFYVAKAPRRERPVVDGVAHPTVKPLALMRWLVRLVTPAGGVVLDPFAGSGTTVEAALLEGFQVVGIEREAEYLPLIQARVDRAA
jgi:site-specific DNA-methyltransferase (adenine-specific)